MEITGIILAGGKSSRMGEDKAFVEYSGKQLISYAILVLQSVCSNIIISANSNEYTPLGFPVVADVYTNCGPIGGLHASLTASTTEHNLVLACDMPHITPFAINSLMSNIGNDEIVCPETEDGNIEPLFAYYNKSVLHSIELQIEKKEFALYKLVKRCATKYIYINDNDVFKNVNNKDDLH